MSYQDCFYASNDGLSLYYREYGKAADKCPIVCLSGLTRNSGDFHALAERYSKDRLVYCLDYRGRGKSNYDPDPSNYNPQTYLGDIMTFLAHTSVTEAVFVGTSLGGLLTMGLGGLAPQHVKAVLLNDIGPEVSSAGGDRIAGYVGEDVRYSSLQDAVTAQKALYNSAYPDLSDDGWLTLCKTSYIFDEEQGNYRANYDLAIGDALKEQINSGESIDLWPFFTALKEMPTLAIRGALSDVLSAEVFQKMLDIHPNMQTLVLENRGHVPLLDEPEALKLMDPFFDQY